MGRPQAQGGSQVKGSRIGRLRYLCPLLVLMAVSCTAGRDLDVSAMTFSDEPLLGKMVWHDLITDDQAAARNFYGALLGWTFEEHSGPGDNPYWLARSGGVYVAGLVAVQPRSDGREISRWLPYLSVADVDRAVETATGGGAEVAVAPRNVPLGRVAALVDPEGAVLGIARSRVGDPDDATTRAGPGRIVWHELLSREPAAAVSFYRDTAGFDVRTVARRGGEYRFLEMGGVRRAGILQMPAPDWDPLWLTYFGVRDVQASAQRVESLGGTVLLAPAEQIREGSMAVIADPSGAVLVLQDWRRMAEEA